MLELARLARTAAEALDAQAHGLARVRDLQARAWAELANAHRVTDDLPAAREAMAEAVCRCRQGTGDPLLLARLADLSATLYTLGEVCGELGRMGLPYKLAKASLDLAVVRLRLGKVAEVEPLVEEMVAVFSALGIRREALTALRLLALIGPERLLVPEQGRDRGGEAGEGIAAGQGVSGAEQ